MDFRKTFDSIPEGFDRWRPRYCDELFREVIRYAELSPGRSALELGPGTGQATEPFLRCGCDYLGIELGENFTKFLRKRFGAYENFRVLNDDFETHDFGASRFDLVFSAATIQWIPEAIAFPKAYALLKPGGALAMFMTRTDETGNGALHDEIEAVYAREFKPETAYTCHLRYENAVNYGFVDFHYMDWKRTRVYDADEYEQYLRNTQVSHLTLPEPYKSRFYRGVREAVLRAGNRIALEDTIALYLTRKPEARPES